MKKEISKPMEQAFIYSKANIIKEASAEFLKLTGYKKDEILGISIEALNKLLKTNFQISFEALEELHSVYIFNKEALAIDVEVKCKFSKEENTYYYYFKKNKQIFLRKLLLNFEDLTISSRQVMAIYSYPDCICLKTNKKYIDNLSTFNNMFNNPLGKRHPYPKYASEIIEKGKSFYEEEIELINDKGIKTYWDMSIKLISGDRKKKYLMLSLYDVSNRVIETKLHDKEKREMELILENISDVITIVNNNGDFTYINKAGIEKFNIKTSHIRLLDYRIQLELFVYSDIYGTNLSYENTPIRRVLRGEHFTNEIIVEVSNTVTNYLECTGIPMYDDLGDISGGIITYRDIGHRIEAEELRLIKTQNDLLNKVVEALDLQLLRCTFPELNIISMNDKAFNNINPANGKIDSIDSLIGKSSFLIYDIDEMTKRKELEFYLLEKAEPSYINYIKYRVDGEERFYKTINQPIFGLKNKIVEIMFITIDVTEEVKEKNLIKENLKIQNEMFTTISHELKTPLSVIFSASQLIEMHLEKEANEIGSENIMANIDIIKQNCYRFTKLINNIIDLSRMQSEFYQLNLKNKNIVVVIESIIESVISYIKEKGLNIIFDTEIEEKIMAIDVEKIDRIMLNLISNSIKFSPKGGNIYINIKDKEDIIEIIVYDYGMGISKKNLDTIFDLYKKADNSLSRNAEGSGIGLALVKTMVELMDGEIKVESELGKGSKFTIKLPVKIIDEKENRNRNDQINNRREKLNIEFSDIYSS